MTRLAIALLAAFWLLSLPARADYAGARAAFRDLAPDDRTAVALALVASGDFEGLVDQGFTPRLYRAIRDFEQHEGFPDDGVLDRDQVQALQDIAGSFYRRLGNKYYTHPDTGARLLVPRRLFDEEKETPEGMLFTRRDGMLSLIFLSFPDDQKSYHELWRTLSAGTGGKRIVYERHFDNRFVVTGTFNTSKFYTMMARTGHNTTGFTFSWGAPFEDLGRKVSTFLANAYLAEIR